MHQDGNKVVRIVLVVFNVYRLCGPIVALLNHHDIFLLLHRTCSVLSDAYYSLVAVVELRKNTIPIFLLII